MTGPGSESPKPTGLWPVMIICLALLLYSIVGCQQLEKPRPAFRLGDVVAFKSDLTVRGTIDSIFCNPGDSYCQYYVTFIPKSGKWAVVSRRFPEYILVKVN